MKSFLAVWDCKKHRCSGEGWSFLSPPTAVRFTSRWFQSNKTSEGSTFWYFNRNSPHQAEIFLAFNIQLPYSDEFGCKQIWINFPLKCLAWESVQTSRWKGFSGNVSILTSHFVSATPLLACWPQASGDIGLPWPTAPGQAMLSISSTLTSIIKLETDNYQGGWQRRPSQTKRITASTF